MPADSVDSCVTDAPYGLSAPPPIADVLAQWLTGEEYVPKSGGGFMGKKWDLFVPGPTYWREVFRVMKPGGHLLCFAGTRTVDLMGIAIRLAGFDVRDSIAWLYGSGFPKSLNVSKEIDRKLGAERPVVGEWHKPGRGQRSPQQAYGLTNDRGLITEAATEAATEAEGYGTALKPAFEPIIVARKPLSGTVAETFMEHGTGALNIDGCRIEMSDEDFADLQAGVEAIRKRGGTMENSWKNSSDLSGANPANQLGRWPANVLLDEWQDRVLRLRGNVNPEVERVVRVYFGSMSELPEEGQDVSEPVGAEEILRPGVLCGASIEDPVGREPSDVRPEACCALNPKDETNQSRVRSRAQGAKLSRVDRGEAHISGVRDDLSGTARPRGAQEVPIDVQGIKPKMRPGASTGHGSASQEAAATGRDCASPEWGKDRQQAAQSGADGQRDPQARASANSSGTTSRATGERAAALTVAESKIPVGWLSLFEETGRVIRRGSAAVLDAQAGEHPGMSGGGVHRADYGGGMFGAIDCPGNARNDSGGPSRFFYTAKASRSERDAGLDDFPSLTSKEFSGREDHSRGTQSPRAGANRNGGARNSHPTVKPIDVMRWLVRLVTRPGSLVLDPFTGSGSTGVATMLEGDGRRFVGLELSPLHVDFARARIAHVVGGTWQRETKQERPVEKKQPSLFDAIGAAK